MSLISHIELIGSSSSWLIAASIRRAPSTVRKDAVVTSVKGILGVGEFNDEPVARSYSDGSVYNPNATRAGKAISIPITFYSNSESTLASTWNAFETMIYSSPTITLKTYGGYNKTYRCQAQLMPPERTEKDRIDCTLVLDAREAI